MSDGFYGTYRGVVVDNNDPVGQGRVVCQIPAVFGKAKSGWLTPHVPTLVKPDINSLVTVNFIDGDLSRGVYHATPKVSAGNVPTDTSAVHLTGAETISGQKTFSTAPLVPTQSALDGTNNAASTAYADNGVATEKTRALNAEATKLSASQNLADVANVSFARTNLGLGNATAVNPNATQTTLGGTTAGSAVWSQPLTGSSYKKVLVQLNGYQNSTATPQTITFPTPFTGTPYLGKDDSAGSSASSTTLTLPVSMATAKTGWIAVEGF